MEELTKTQVEKAEPKAEPKAGHVEPEGALDKALQGGGPGEAFGVVDAVVPRAADHDAVIMMEGVQGEGRVDRVVGGDVKAGAEVLSGDDGLLRLFGEFAEIHVIRSLVFSL